MKSEFLKSIRGTKRAIAAISALAFSGFAGAADFTVFADHFEDGNVSDWSVSSSANITGPNVTVRIDSVHQGAGALWTYFDAPSGGTGAGFVRASHSLLAPVAANYTISLWARSSPCQGCTMFYDVLLDGNSLAHTGTSQNAFEPRSFSAALAAGTHTLTLGMYTNAASSGRFNASFDDVTVTTSAPIPEPDSYAMMLAGIGLAGFAARRRTRNPGV